MLCVNKQRLTGWLADWLAGGMLCVKNRGSLAGGILCINKGRLAGRLHAGQAISLSSQFCVDCNIPSHLDSSTVLLNQHEFKIDKKAARNKIESDKK